MAKIRTAAVPAATGYSELNLAGPFQLTSPKSKIKAPMLGHFATRDVPFPIAKVDELEKKLRAANVKFEFHRYDAKHAFANETANEKKLEMLQHDPKAAELAWKRTLDFLGKNLK